MTSPLLDLFYQLRDEQGFLLSIEQYYRVENYLIQKLANDSDIAIQENNIGLAPSFPYVKDENGTSVKIPEALFPDVITLIKSRSGGILEYIKS
jgi:hypothetical protein